MHIHAAERAYLTCSQQHIFVSIGNLSASLYLLCSRALCVADRVCQDQIH